MEKAASTFYDKVLGVLGHRRVMDFGIAIGYGTDKPDFWISTFDGIGPNREMHLAFQASDADARTRVRRRRRRARRRGAARAAAVAGVPRRATSVASSATPRATTSRRSPTGATPPHDRRGGRRRGAPAGPRGAGPGRGGGQGGGRRGAGARADRRADHLGRRGRRSATGHHGQHPRDLRSRPGHRASRPHPARADLRQRGGHRVRWHHLGHGRRQPDVRQLRAGPGDLA